MLSTCNLLQYFIPVIFIAAISCTSPEKPVTEQEAIQFAHTIENWIKKDSAKNLNTIIDVATFTSHIEAHAGSASNQSFVDGVRDAMKNMDLGQQIAKGVGKTGSYLLVKQYEKNKHQHLIFRMYGDAQVNYHDYELIKKDDKVKVADLFIYTTGEELSETLANSMLMMAEDSRNMSDEEINKLNDFKVIKSLMSKGNYSSAKNHYDALPEQFKRQKLFQVLNILICKELGDSVYLNAMDEYKVLYPAEPNMFLMMIDAYILKKDYANALHSVDQLDSLINKDPFLDYYRALIYKLEDDNEQYEKYLEALNHNMPDFKEGTIQLIYCYLDNHEMDKAVALTKTFIRSDQYDKGDLDLYFMLYPDLKKAVDE